MSWVEFTHQSTIPYSMNNEFICLKYLQFFLQGLCEKKKLP